MILKIHDTCIKKSKKEKFYLASDCVICGHRISGFLNLVIPGELIIKFAVKTCTF